MVPQESNPLPPQLLQVHRYTHRIVRGTLLAVGRPDARLPALSRVDKTVCLAVSQASSIINLGVGCETLTLGHHPHKLSLAAVAIKLPTVRPAFAVELAGGASGPGATPWRRAERRISIGGIYRASSVQLLEHRAAPESGESAEATTGARLVHGARVVLEDVERPPMLQAPPIGAWMSQQEREAGRGELLEALYETRFAALQRFIGFIVMFHRLAQVCELGKGKVPRQVRLGLGQGWSGAECVGGEVGWGRTGS